MKRCNICQVKEGVKLWSLLNVCETCFNDLESRRKQMIEESERLKQ